jgi:hypothetical protein
MLIMGISAKNVEFCRTKQALVFVDNLEVIKSLKNVKFPLLIF